MRGIIRLTVVFSFISFNARGQIIAPLENSPISGAEYFVGKELGKPLITVNLLNGVGRPGVYHVPSQTTLPQLLAYAGGSTSYADTTDIRIRRIDHEKSIFMRHDLNEIINDNQPFPVISDKDVVQIREKNTLDSTLRWVTIYSGIATTMLSIALVTQYSRGK